MDPPRLCGEKHSYMQNDERKKGSPPPMRGKVDEFKDIVCKAGITPAYAGKSMAERFSRGIGRDHPRLCGEKPV